MYLESSRISKMELSLRKMPATFTRYVFSQKSFLVNVRLGSKYASEYDNNFFPDVSKLELMTFRIFLTIHFSYQRLPEAKAYLEPSRTSAMELFREKKFFFEKISRKSLCGSLFLIKLQASILQLHLMKGHQQAEVFSDEFCKIFRTPFYRTPPGDCFCFTEKYFINKMVKKPSKKKKWKQLVRKRTTHAEQKLNQYLYQFFISFYYSKILLFSAFHEWLKARVLRDNAIPLRMYLL